VERYQQRRARLFGEEGGEEEMVCVSQEVLAQDAQRKARTSARKTHKAQRNSHRVAVKLGLAQRLCRQLYPVLREELREILYALPRGRTSSCWRFGAIICHFFRMI
jgi:hypothetical protein